MTHLVTISIIALVAVASLFIFISNVSQMYFQRRSGQRYGNAVPPAAPSSHGHRHHQMLERESSKDLDFDQHDHPNRHTLEMESMPNLDIEKDKELDLRGDEHQYIPKSEGGGNRGMVVRHQQAMPHDEASSQQPASAYEVKVAEAATHSLAELAEPEAEHRSYLRQVLSQLLAAHRGDERQAVSEHRRFLRQMVEQISPRGDS